MTSWREDELLPTVRFLTELRARFKEDMEASDPTCIDSLYTDSLIVPDSKFAEELKRYGTSVTSISTDNDGPSEYYNLNGQRITAPADKRQLYIERRNGKATVRVRR